MKMEKKMETAVEGSEFSSIHVGFCGNNGIVTAIVSWQAPSSFRLQIHIRRESPKSVTIWNGQQRERSTMRVWVGCLH